MKSKCYFAAANGYTGFRSYFEHIFNSEEYKRIFVLKGGPGTGKSTLMQRISDAALYANIECDKIFCSSDPNSLDGVIIYTLKGKFAVIDGTAPHQRDATVPGAIDLLIDLGEGFDISNLEMHRDEILDLDKKKKNAYIEGYTYLRLAGEINKKIDALLDVGFNNKKAPDIVNSISINENEKVEKTKIALISAFGRYGYYILKGYPGTENIYKIRNSYGEAYKILKTIANNLGQKCEYISYNPLWPGAIDRIVSGNISYVCTSNADADFNALDCISSAVSREELTMLKEMHDGILSIAQKKFDTAALLHSDLEKIYSSSIDFAKNEHLTNQIIDTIL